MKRWIILLLLAHCVMAAPPQPFCEINAEILSIQDGVAEARVVEVVRMTSAGMSEGYSCSDLYAGKTINDVTIEDGIAREGTFVNGVITYFGDEFSAGYSMAEVREIDPIFNEEEKRKAESFWPRLIAAMLFLMISMAATAFIILKKRRGEL